MCTNGSRRRSIVSLKDVKTSLERGKLPHALLFLGPAGAGQLDAARELAQALFCAERQGAAACGKCTSCRQVASGNHPDFKVIEPEEDSRTLKIEAVRTLLAQANLKPFQAPAKVFVIDRAEAMREDAQSVLLKTLEEPPPHTYFVLISYAAEKMLSTVRSRAQEVRFYQSEEDVPPESGNEESERAVIDFILGGRRPELAGSTREEALQVLEAVIRDLRGALLAGVGAVRADGRPGRTALAERFSEEELIDRIEKLAAFKEKIAQNVNTKLAFSVLWDEL